MEWIIIQVTPWAEKHLLTKELASELRRRISIPDLELYYPSVEDVVGKHSTAYSEYLFVEYRVGVNYHELEGNEFFRSILKKPKGGYEIMQDTDIEKIRAQIEAEQKLEAGDQVIVYQGPLKGNRAEVIEHDEQNQVILRVLLGEEKQDAVVPRHWVRKREKRVYK